MSFPFTFIHASIYKKEFMSLITFISLLAKASNPLSVHNTLMWLVEYISKLLT